MICTFLCAPFSGSSQQLLGDSLFAAGDFRRALIAFDYALFSGMDSDVTTVLIKKSWCLKRLANYPSGMQVLDAANFYSGTDSVRFLLFYEYIAQALLGERYDLALSKIQEAHVEIADSARRNQLLPFEILALNGLERWSEAHERYLAWKEAGMSDPYPAMLSGKRKNPDKAGTLSYLLPGVGQWYAGYFGKGFTSMALNTGLVGFSVWSFATGYYFSAAFTGVALFYLSYNGGARYAEVLAKQYNEERARAFNEKVREIIIEAELKKRKGP